MSVPPDPSAAGAPPVATLASPGPSGASSGPGTGLEDRPELLAAGAFAGGLTVALILKRLGR